MSTLLQDMGINHSGSNILMSKQSLDSSNVSTSFKKMRSEAMAESMCRYFLFNAYLFYCSLFGFIDNTGVNMVSSSIFTSRVF